MQRRQTDRKLYFKELAVTSEKYFVPYIKKYIELGPETKVLEIGCGDGGNLLPLAKMGCSVLGCDISATRINDAIKFFKEEGVSAEFIASDVFLLEGLEKQFDLIICHDVIEHISDKYDFMSKCQRLLKPQGVLFVSFPAWQMPFGGHQQICRGRILSHLPFFHLFPSGIYRKILQIGGESEGCIKELLSIKETRCPIELFHSVLDRLGCYEIINREGWFINPHYEIKFGLKPRKINKLIDKIPYIRDFFTTSSFYILKLK